MVTKLISHLLNVSVYLLIVFSLPCNAAQMGGPRPGQPPVELTAEDIAMLQEVEQEINKFVESLPPEEQKKFWQDVDELSKTMSNMSEDELVNFMEGVFKDELPPVPPTAPVEQPTTFAPKAPAPQPEKKAAPAAQPLPVSKQEAAIELLDGIISHINNFIRKSQAIPELSEKVTSWGNKGKLKNWSPSLSWAFVKTKIEELDQKLNKLKDRDPAGKYRYVDELIKDEALYNNLSQLRVNLSTNEPRIQVASFGIERLSKPSRQAIINVLNSLQEALTLLSIPKGIDAIIAKYEPTAKMLKEEGEKLEKQALEDARRPKFVQPSTVAGRAPEEPRFDQPTPSGDYFGRDFGTRPSFAPSAPQQPEKRTPEPEKPKADKPAGPSADKAPKAEPDKKKEEEDKRAQDLIKDITNAFDSILEAFDNNKELRNLQSYLTTSKSVSDVPASLNSVVSAVRNATSKTNSLKRQFRRLKPDQRATYKKELNAIYNDYKADLDKFIGQVSTIEQRWPVMRGRLAGDKNAKDVKLGLFGEGDKPSGTTLLDVRDKMNELKKAISEL